MKLRFILLLALLVPFCLAAEQKEDIQWEDASQFTIINRANVDKTHPFQRLREESMGGLSEKMVKYYRYSTGVAVMFKTTSNTIRARWNLRTGHWLRNMTFIATSGLDLYIKRDGEWVFAGYGAEHALQKKNQEFTLVKDMENGYKECLLYLPLFNYPDGLELGLNRGCQIKPLENPFASKVVLLGSSITHGASASRPGMTYAALLERNLNVEFINLGISGLCKLEPGLASMISSLKADAYIVEGFSNPTSQQINERLENFITIVRKTHPDIPLIFIQTEVRENTSFDKKYFDKEKAKRDAAREILQRLRKEDRNLYFLEPGLYLGEDHEATSDGIHPNDLGMYRIYRHLQPKLEKIFRKYKIR
ncbi:MAG: SGNH/GDSL hydrolase family protein [Alistipes sp.]|nr:SGNH/GDSL hydrolase family protein [Candidatus Alistipes equi]